VGSVAGLAGIILLVGGFAFGAVKVNSVDGVAMSVADLDRSVDFYSRVLSFKKVSENELAGDEVEKLLGVFGSRVRMARMKLGDESIELRQFLAPEGQAYPSDTRSNDQWFQHIAIIVRDMDKAYKVLRENKVRRSSPTPQRLPDWNKNAGGIKAFYFKDPDGHPLEILEFPAGKGNPKWHRPGNDLFMGIDHTAIVVSSTDRSLKFYRDDLGFTVGGESENYGIEQERLNNVAGAHLRITGLKSPAGPGIEFLEYLAPAGGRKAPENIRANDLVATETLLSVQQAENPVLVNKNDFGFSKGKLTQDPDGHAILMTEK
jgi:catechol 2,3-dioxygenase-like lactoylglutathione lyase family enzyme